MGLPELPVLGSPSDEFPLTGGVIEIRAKGECSAAFRAFRGLPENKSVTDNPAGSVVFHRFASFPLKVSAQLICTVKITLRKSKYRRPVNQYARY